MVHGTAGGALSDVFVSSLRDVPESKLHGLEAASVASPSSRSSAATSRAATIELALSSHFATTTTILAHIVQTTANFALAPASSTSTSSMSTSSTASTSSTSAM